MDSICFSSSWLSAWNVIGCKVVTQYELELECHSRVYSKIFRLHWRDQITKTLYILANHLCRYPCISLHELPHPLHFLWFDFLQYFMYLSGHFLSSASGDNHTNIPQEQRNYSDDINWNMIKLWVKLNDVDKRVALCNFYCWSLRQEMKFSEEYMQWYSKYQCLTVIYQKWLLALYFNSFP